jgi:uncharacterized repeat protein (TIGR03833 family)
MRSAFAAARAGTHAPQSLHRVTRHGRGQFRGLRAAKTCAAKGASDDETGRRREALALHQRVEIRVTPRPGADPSADIRAVGTITDFLTNSSYHAEGIKVRISTGAIGRVTRVDPVDDAEGAEDCEQDDDDEEEEDEDDKAMSMSSDVNAPSRASSNASASSSEETVAVRTAHVSNVSKSAPKAEVKGIAENLPGVVNVRVPTRTGGHMGYIFIECVDGDAVKSVIAKLHGVEFHGKTLDAKFAKSDPKPKPPKKKKVEKKSTEAKGTGAKLKTLEETAGERKMREQAEETERRILQARTSMEVDALLELERAKRKRDREQKAIEEQEALRRTLEEDRERRARNVLEQRRLNAERRAARAQAAADARDALERRARELGDITLPSSWALDVRALRDKIDRLRIDAERD